MIETIRSINLLVASLLVLWLLCRRFRRREWYFKGSLRRDVWAVVFCWSLALVLGTVEQLFRTDTVFRAPVSTIALICTIAIMVRPENDWAKGDVRDSG